MKMIVQNVHIAQRKMTSFWRRLTSHSAEVTNTDIQFRLLNLMGFINCWIHCWSFESDAAAWGFRFQARCWDLINLSAISLTFNWCLVALLELTDVDKELFSWWRWGHEDDINLKSLRIKATHKMKPDHIHVSR